MFVCAFLELPVSTLVKTNPENTHTDHTQKSSIPVWSETLCISPHLSPQDCHHPSYHAHSLTPCHYFTLPYSLPENWDQWGLQLRESGFAALQLSCTSLLIAGLLPFHLFPFLKKMQQLSLVKTGIRTYR